MFLDGLRGGKRAVASFLLTAVNTWIYCVITGSECFSVRKLLLNSRRRRVAETPWNILIKVNGYFVIKEFFGGVNRFHFSTH